MVSSPNTRGESSKWSRIRLITGWLAAPTRTMLAAIVLWDRSVPPKRPSTPPPRVGLGTVYTLVSLMLHKLPIRGECQRPRMTRLRTRSLYRWGSRGAGV